MVTGNHLTLCGLVCPLMALSGNFTPPPLAYRNKAKKFKRTIGYIFLKTIINNLYRNIRISFARLLLDILITIDEIECECLHTLY